MAKSFSRLIILQAAFVCLIPLAANAKLSDCEKWLAPGQANSENREYVVGTIGITTSEKNGANKAYYIPRPLYTGLPDENPQNTLLWMVRGTANLDSLPHDRKLLDEGNIRLAYPFKAENGRTYKIEFVYEQTNPEAGDYIGVLKKIKILDEVSFKVDVKAEIKDGPETDNLIYNLAHGSRDLIYGIEINKQIIHFKSHLSVDDLKTYKEFFENFFTHDTYLFGRRRTLHDLNEISTSKELERTAQKLTLDRKLQWYKDRLHKIATTLVVVAAATSASAATTYYYQHLNFTPKEIVINGLSHERYGEIKMFGVAQPGGRNQFRVSAEDEVRLKDESTIRLKDKNGKEVVFSAGKSSKGHLRLELLNPEEPK